MKFPNIPSKSSDARRFSPLAGFSPPTPVPPPPSRRERHHQRRRPRASWGGWAPEALNCGRVGQVPLQRNSLDSTAPQADSARGRHRKPVAWLCIPPGQSGAWPGSDSGAGSRSALTRAPLKRALTCPFFLVVFWPLRLR
jgi:hypothetical protein